METLLKKTNHDATVGNHGVRANCVNKNHETAKTDPSNPPTITWEAVWY